MAGEVHARGLPEYTSWSIHVWRHAHTYFHYKLLQAKNQAARSPALEPDQHAWMEVTGDQQLAIEALVTRVGLLVLHSIHQ
jgi:hypothetical protein